MRHLKEMVAEIINSGDKLLAEAKKQEAKSKLRARAKDQFKEYSVEVALAVADHDEDFDATERDIKGAKAEFNEEAAREHVVVKKIVSVEFVEFDSGNPTHAMAYFDVTYIGNKEITYE